MLEQSNIIKILKYVAEKGGPFTGTEIRDATGIPWSEISRYAARVFTNGNIKDGIFGSEYGDPLSWTHPNETPDGKYHVMYPAMMNYLDYLELQEARRSSMNAMRVAYLRQILSVR